MEMKMYVCFNILGFKLYHLLCINALIFHVSSFTICYINALVIKLKTKVLNNRIYLSLIHI